MSDQVLAFNEDRAVERLLRFLSVEGITGQEKAIAREVTRTLREVGVPAKAIRHDTAHERIPLATQTGNLIVTLPGSRPGKRLLFMTHLDTVPLCAGAVPVRVGKDRIKARHFSRSSPGMTQSRRASSTWRSIATGTTIETPSSSCCGSK